MPTADPVEALVVVTPQHLDAVTALLGPDKVHRVVIAENNIAAFWSDGPKIMAQIGNPLPDAEQPRLKAWDDLAPDDQATAVGMAAGALDWAEDGTLHESYVASVLESDPELHAALLHPAGITPPRLAARGKAYAIGTPQRRPHFGDRRPAGSRYRHRRF